MAQKNWQKIKLVKLLELLRQESDEQQLFSIPWGHHIQIINKCKGNVDKAVFYVKQTIANNWSRNVLMNQISNDLYSRQGKAASNFAELLPNPQGALTQEITKDPYIFDFLTLRSEYDEPGSRYELRRR